MTDSAPDTARSPEPADPPALAATGRISSDRAHIAVPIMVFCDMAWLLGFGAAAYKDDTNAKQTHERVQEWMAYMEVIDHGPAEAESVT